MSWQSLKVLKVCLKRETRTDNLSSSKSNIILHLPISPVPPSFLVISKLYLPVETVTVTSKPVSEYDLGWPAAWNSADWIWHSQVDLHFS